MKIGVISDIHDNIKNLSKAIKILNKQKVSQVLFCGDLVSPKTIVHFSNLKAPVKAVIGNMDAPKQNILKKIKENKLDVKYPDGSELIFRLTINAIKIALFHGKPEDAALKLVESCNFDFVFSGHTHLHHIKKLDKTTWINPGPICGYMGFEKKPVKPSLSIVDLKTNNAKIITF